MYAATFGCKSMATFWVQSLCLLRACLWLGWVQSMRKLGAKYMDTFGCMSMPFGGMYAAFGCMYMARLGACLRLLGACLTVGSFA